MQIDQKKPVFIQDFLSLETQTEFPVEGRHVRLNGEDFLGIDNPDQMPEFFMSMVSSHDHWMFVSSRGAVTAGRCDSNSSIFPYYSADKLSDMRESTGPKTIIRISRFGQPAILWEPFSGNVACDPNRRQRILKNATGNKLWLEETNDALGLVFRYRWSFGPKFGFVRTSEICNIGSESLAVEILDGCKNIIPHGTDQQFQLRFSNLADAYKKCESDRETGIAVYYLNSIPTDLAEPSEGLRATVVWHFGLHRPTILLSEKQLNQFRKNGEVTGETILRGQRGCWFAHQKLILKPEARLNGSLDESKRSWTIVIDTGYDQTDVINLGLHKQLSQDELGDEVARDIADCEEKLTRIVAMADGVQLGRDQLRLERHLSNTTFNVMRGGIPLDRYSIQSGLFADHVRSIGPSVFRNNREFLAGLKPVVELRDLLALLAKQGDRDLLRIGQEYLPFSFSRRHGDPTRPWNAFSIRVNNPDGTQVLNYEGNWRDIFQNWEALSLSFPGFCKSMIFRFVNATTADGYNPYRISSTGIEWETPDEDDPWSNIGYWGDHQIVYLLKLIEQGRRFEPGGLDGLLGEDICVFANVPYRIRDYQSIRQNPRTTVGFDIELAHRIESRENELGNEAKLLTNGKGELCRSNLAEKLLIPSLAKMSNFVPGGGVWLTTQRPEWNDANNALAGYGLSVVTACYLRRYFACLADWFETLEQTAFSVSTEVALLMEDIVRVLSENSDELAGELTARERRKVVDGLGIAGSKFREQLYANGLGGEKTKIPVDRFVGFFRLAMKYLDHTIRFNRRTDGLYHSFNLLNYEPDGSEDRIVNLGEMLEGQVAILSSGVVDDEECVSLLDSLRSSALYRPDQQSYMLCADRVLPRFQEKNRIPAEAINRSLLLQLLLTDGNQTIIKRDLTGGLHFNGDFRNANDLFKAIDALENDERYAPLVKAGRQTIADIFEDVFHHREFTGRSGSFFGYEGLGSVYWHMVSKLLLAIQENLLRLKNEGCKLQTLQRLRMHYRDVREGLGLKKTPAHYGAFPTDPYSHTPKHAGVQQPGMTGQVKEDIVVRINEIGVRIQGGKVSFDSWLFERSELLNEPATFRYYDAKNVRSEIEIPENSFAFTFCQVPVVYRLAREPGLTIYHNNGQIDSRENCTLGKQESESLFARTGEIAKIEVRILPDPDN